MSNIIDYNKFIGGKEASKKLGVHQRTLYLWEEKGYIDTIRTPGGKRLYNVEKCIEHMKQKNETKKLEKTEKKDNEDDLINIEGKLNIVYVRVSSAGQKDDLIRQRDEMIKKYPNHNIIEDIGSGINFNRRGIRKIIKLAIAGKINEVVVAYKDRLTRFGYELIEDIIKEYSNGKIIILNSKEEIEPEEELAKDVLQIMNVFVAKMNGLRKYNKD